MPLSALPIINYSPSADTMEDVFDKNNDVRDRVQGYVLEAIDSGQAKLYYGQIAFGWDMDSTATINIAHGVSDYRKIRMIEVVIYNNAATESRKLDIVSNVTGAADGQVGVIDATSIQLGRRVGGIFDSVDFNGGGTRGYVTLIISE